ncbi:uncharacterized protein LOC115782519 isoform X1 [Archocentrus centrarchus]|uniref:uncharacterized protein LOC115782519 isoform X1 n=1 Tax=Archocentrus centrarchus TaxID=63155 RepID=UPI0011E9C5B0|nr:uncharacterized protein LOC115782519 isoform X1 [Archocentrus centrarchus]XP_030588578.1 uncharacterized protein LOC115782519 isoform X1 [Archocentrus centrarchus]XP_030588579.1 uncharacterized protein LOC115782519 isoform X1 [Archocentrus centrarchus]
MLVKVRFGETQKYVKVAETEDGYDDFSTFLQKVIVKLGLALETELHLTDESGTEVDADVFEDLLQAGNLTVRVTTEKSTVVLQHDLSSTSLESTMSDNSSVSVSGDSLLASSDSSDATVIVHTNGGTRTHAEREAAKEMVRNALQVKPGGQVILDEYDKLRSLTDGTRRRLVNLLVANMVEIHGMIPPVSVRTKYALGIISLFPSLKDPYSDNGYEHFYDQQSGSGYLAWRIKTVQRNSAAQSRRSSTSTAYQDSPKRKREVSCTDKQLLGEECREAISFLKYSTDESAVKEKMRATFQYRQTLVQDQQCSSTVLDVFPRFLNITGLIDQDFTMMFGEEVSGRFLAKWPTFFKPRILTECRKLTSNEHIEELLYSQHDTGWDSDLSSILLLLHLLPPTSKGHKKSAKISSCQAVDHVVRYLQMGASVETFLAGVEPGQPFLLCVGENKSSIQRYYIIIDHKAVPCKAQTSLAAFDELFKAHFIFSVNYHESLYNFYTFIQTTVFNIDVGHAKESPRVRELRARFLHDT